MTANRLLAGEREIASLIDHTLLKPEAAEKHIMAVCQQALEFHFASVCVNPAWVPLVHSQLAHSQVKTCSVIGFPLGVSRTASKVEEIQQIAAAAHSAGAILKVILETCLLTDTQKTLACQISKEAGADFVKTSTGFSTGGATESDVALMRSAVGPALGVKASGGVRSFDALARMVRAGASRIGTSSGPQILAQFNAGTWSPESGAGGSY